ncbi:MAG: helix-turn-helix domain-containing protein [Planctomycetota bacterium]|jgi:antitoxin component HigA of HigAB toxin-antitoxin module
MSKTRRIPDTISGQLRWYLEHCGESNYRLERETGISNAALSRFLRQNRGLTLETVDKLAKHLGLRLVRDAN